MFEQRFPGGPVPQEEMLPVGRDFQLKGDQRRTGLHADDGMFGVSQSDVNSHGFVRSVWRSFHIAVAVVVPLTIAFLTLRCLRNLRRHAVKADIGRRLSVENNGGEDSDNGGGDDSEPECSKPTPSDDDTVAELEVQAIASQGDEKVKAKPDPEVLFESDTSSEGALVSLLDLRPSSTEERPGVSPTPDSVTTGSILGVLGVNDDLPDARYRAGRLGASSDPALHTSQRKRRFLLRPNPQVAVNLAEGFRRKNLFSPMGYEGPRPFPPEPGREGRPVALSDSALASYGDAEAFWLEELGSDWSSSDSLEDIVFEADAPSDRPPRPSSTPALRSPVPFHGGSVSAPPSLDGTPPASMYTPKPAQPTGDPELVASVRRRTKLLSLDMDRRNARSQAVYEAYKKMYASRPWVSRVWLTAPPRPQRSRASSPEGAGDEETADGWLESQETAGAAASGGAGSADRSSSDEEAVGDDEPRPKQRE